MYKAKVNGREIEVKIEKTAKAALIDGKEIIADILKIKEDSYHILQKDRSYNIEVINIDRLEKTVELNINGNPYTVNVRDRYDELLHRLGMDNLTAQKVNDLKAPMPGLVVSVHVTEGQPVKNGEVLILLEAMKMENTLKATADAIVKKIAVKKGQAVEKNEVLIYLS